MHIRSWDSMDREKNELVLDNPLFSPTERSREKCSDGSKETESTKKAARSMPGHMCEIAVSLPNTLKSSEMASPEPSRRVRDSSGSKTGNVVQSMVYNQFDEESQDMEEFRARMRKFMGQEDEAACIETGHIPSPLIIQYGGVASYHPVYSPCAHRPRFRRFQGDAPTPTIKDSPEMKRSEEGIKEDMPQSKNSSSGGDEDATAAENGRELAQNAGLDDKGNYSISPSSAEPAAGHTEGQKSVETDHKIAANCLNRKDTGIHFIFRKRVSLTIAIILLFSIPYTSTAIKIREACSLDLNQTSGVNSTGFKEHLERFQELSVADMKSIFNLDGLKESWKASIRKISDFGLSCFQSHRFSYFRSVGGCLMMKLYENLKSIRTRFMDILKIFCTDLLACMMNIAAEFLRFYKCFDSKRVVDSDPRYPRAEIHGTIVGKFEKNQIGHEKFEQFVLSLILGMDICPREGSMNTCPILKTQGIEDDRNYDDFYNEDRTVPVIIQRHDDIEFIQGQANSPHAETHNSPKLHQISAEDQENRLWAGNEISEISLSFPEQTEIQINLEDLCINGTSEGPFIEQNPHEFWWLVWVSLLVAASLLLILLIHRFLIRRIKSASGPYSSLTSKRMLNKSGGDHIPESKEKQKSIERYFGTKNQTTMEFNESAGYGSFIDYVEIPVPNEGSRSKELKTTPVRRSMRIRHGRLSPLRRGPTFTSPLQ